VSSQTTFRAFVGVFTNNYSFAPLSLRFPLREAFRAFVGVFTNKYSFAPLSLRFPLREAFAPLLVFSPTNIRLPRSRSVSRTAKLSRLWWCYRQKENVILPSSYAKNLFGDSPTSAPFFTAVGSLSPYRPILPR
jgi:hypothetical protein